MATIRLLFGLLCLSAVFGHRMPAGHLLSPDRTDQLLNLARGQLDIREKGGANHGPEVKAYLAYVHLSEGYPWCAAFISWVFGKAGYAQPRTAWSPALFPASRLKSTAKPATVYGIYFKELKRIAHCGIVENTRNDWIIGIEGNTNLAGSAEGDGVYRKWRHRRTVALYAQWLPKSEIHP